jgi:hypothetical protein
MGWSPNGQELYAMHEIITVFLLQQLWVAYMIAVEKYRCLGVITGRYKFPTRFNGGRSR